MRPTSLLPLTAAAAGFVLPDVETFSQLPVHGQQPQPDDSSWHDWFPSSTSPLASSVHDVVSSLSSGVEETFNFVKDKFEAESANIFDDDVSTRVLDVDRPHHRHKPHHTIYELISTSKYTTKFAKLVNDHDDIVEMLNSTAANYTLFVPHNDAFEHLPKDKTPSREFIEAVLRYHIGLGVYPALRVLVTHTIPSALNERLLGNRPQRLRTSVGLLSGVRVNFYSKVLAVDIGAINGVIHAVSNFIVPPPYVGRELALLPAKFSTLLLAYEKTDFTSFVHKQVFIGSTVFAPDNAAFERLGPAVNAFLFNTDKGRRYLTALLKYHIVANQTVYSDAYYPSAAGGKAEEQGDVGRGHYHFDLPTLLGDKRIAVDVARYLGQHHVKVNGYIPITVQDAVARNGVIHVPAQVLIPPHKPHKHGRPADEASGEISVEEFKERFAGYVEDEGTSDESEL